MNAIQYLWHGQVCLLFLFSSVGLSGQELLNLEQCLKAVRAADANTMQLTISAAIGDAQTKINRLAYLPQLDLNGRASWQSDVTHINADFPGVEIPSPDADQYAISVDLIQPIYSGGMIKARDAVINAEVEVSAMQHRLGAQSTDELATALYYQVALHQHLARVQTLLIQQLDQVIALLERNYRAGTVGKTDLLDAQIKQIEAHQRQTEALQKMQLSKASLAVLMATDTSAFRIDASFLLPPPDTSGSIDRRIEMQFVDAQTELVRAQNDFNKTQYRPVVSLFATAGYGKPGLNFLNDAFDTYLVFGASLKIPLTSFYSGKSSREYQVNLLQQESLGLKKNLVERELKLKALSYSAEVDKLDQWLQEDDEIIELFREVVRIGRVRLDGGTITTSEYLDNLTSLSLAEEQKAIHETQRQQNLALLNLLYVSMNLQNQ